MALTQQSGFDFPMVRKGPRGRIIYVGQDTLTLINASLEQIVLTMPGERWWNPSFGCKVRKLQFEGLTSSTVALVKNMVLDAIQQWEPRVTVSPSEVVVYAIEVADPGGALQSTLQIQVAYTVVNPDFTSTQNTGSVTIVI